MIGDSHNNPFYENLPPLQSFKRAEQPYAMHKTTLDDERRFDGLSPRTTDKYIAHVGLNGWYIWSLEGYQIPIVHATRKRNGIS